MICRLRTIGPKRFQFSSRAFFFCSSKQNVLDRLHPYLRENLKAQKLHQLKDFQEQSFQAIESNKNCFVNSCTGSGKTLAYLIPAINRILWSKQENPHYKDQRHGALIFTLNKELCLQVYRQIRKIDRQNRLNVSRLGPVSYFSPVISELNNPKKTPEDEQEIQNKISHNLTKCVDWRNTDILIITPQLFWNIMTGYVRNNAINPQFLVIDEADLLLEIDKNISRHMKWTIEMLQRSRGNTKKPLSKALKNVKNFFSARKTEVTQEQSQKQAKVQYMLCSSSFPKKVDRVPFDEYIEKEFSPIQIVSGINRHRLPDRIDLNYVQIQTVRNCPPGHEDDQVDKEKLFYLGKILTSPEHKNSRCLIFCGGSKTVDKVSIFLKDQLSRKPIRFHAGLSSEQRSQSLLDFSVNSDSVLVSTELGSRGLDFDIPVEMVVEFDMATNIVSFINRAGRTARNNMPGSIITFVEKHNKEFFEHLSEVNSNDEQIDSLFSRKRSYSKMLLRDQRRQSEN